MDFEHEEHFETRQVDVGDVHVVWDEKGEGQRPLVLVHGFSGSRKDFAPLLPDVADLGRVLAPALRGHADGCHVADPSEYTLDAATADLVGWLDELAIERCDLLGHSMGGYVVERMVLEHPERVGSLILMDTAGRSMSWLDAAVFEVGGKIAVEQGIEQLHAILRERAADDPERSVADRRLEEEWGAERFWAWRRERFVGMDPHAFAPFGRALAEHPDWLSRLAEVRCPTLVVVGEHDGPFLETSSELAGAIPGARHVVVSDAGHQPQLESPAAFTRVLREHLADARGA